MLAKIPGSILENVHLFSDSLSYLKPEGKAAYLKFTSLKCDKCFKKLSLPFKVFIFRPDGTESIEDDTVVLEEDGVHVYLHDGCKAEIVS